MKDQEIEEVRCGTYHTLLRKRNGEILAFGKNNSGELGIGNEENQLKPVPINF
jgi:alpha-tubulin suppressor-like RCC1 family protein